MTTAAAAAAMESGSSTFVTCLMDKLLSEGRCWTRELDPGHSAPNLKTKLALFAPPVTNSDETQTQDLYMSCTLLNDASSTTHKAPVTVYTAKLSESFFVKHVKKAGLRVNSEQFASIFRRALESNGETLAAPALELEGDSDTDNDENGGDNQGQDAKLPDKLTLTLQYLKEEYFEINGELALKKKKCDDIDILSLLWACQGSATSQPIAPKDEDPDLVHVKTKSEPIASSSQELEKESGTVSLSQTSQNEATHVKQEEPEIKKEEETHVKTEVKQESAQQPQRAQPVKKRPPPMGLNPGKKRKVGGGAKIGGGSVK